MSHFHRRRCVRVPNTQIFCLCVVSLQSQHLVSSRLPNEEAAKDNKSVHLVLRYRSTGNRFLKCRDDTNARSRWPSRCVGSPLRASTFAASPQNDLLFVIIGRIDRSGSPPGKRHSQPPHICLENVRIPDDKPRPSAAGLAFVSLFSTHRCHLGRSIPNKTRSA